MTQLFGSNPVRCSIHSLIRSCATISTMTPTIQVLAKAQNCWPQHNNASHSTTVLAKAQILIVVLQASQTILNCTNYQQKQTNCTADGSNDHLAILDNQQAGLLHAGHLPEALVRTDAASQTPTIIHSQYTCVLCSSTSASPFLIATFTSMTIFYFYRGHHV